MAAIDVREFRNALGQFATGVTIVTTFDADRRPTGVTASSFNSVSLDPPLVLWSLAKSAQSLSAFRDSGYFAVHVLASDQQAMSNRFARSGEEKFAGVDFATTPEGVPLFENCAARFVCKTASQYEGGDHIILVGEVTEFETSAREPLLFHSGDYKEARVSPDLAEPEAMVDIENATFSEDFFSYLLARAHFQFSLPTMRLRGDWGMSEVETLCLSLLSLTPGLTLLELEQRLEHTGRIPDEATLGKMQQMKWVESQPGEDGQLCYRNSSEGRSKLVELLANAKLMDESLKDAFTQSEIAEFRGYLRRLVAHTDPGVPSLFNSSPV